MNQSSAVTFGMGTFVDVGAGFEATCAATNMGKVVCAGHDGVGQQGNGPSKKTDQLTPFEVDSLTTAATVDVGNDFACSTTSMNQLFCWGSNNYRELGNGKNANEPSPAEALMTISGQAASVAAGQDFACAVTTMGGAFCWGYNHVGQTGTGNTNSPVDTPTQLMGLNQVTKVDLGAFHGCALTMMGDVFCWGYNNEGQVGDGTLNNAAMPVQVNLGDPATDIGLGERHSCAVVNGGAKCWGRGTDGQLGNGAAASSTVPVDVMNVSQAQGLAAGTKHSCALLNDGTVMCWGGNDVGQLGNGTTTNSLMPVMVQGL